MSPNAPRRLAGFLAREWPYVLCVLVVVASALGGGSIENLADPDEVHMSPAEEARLHEIDERPIPAAVRIALTVVAGLVIVSLLWIYAVRSAGGQVFPEAPPLQVRWNEWDIIKLVFVAALLSGVSFLCVRSGRRSDMIAANSAAMLAAVVVALHIVRSRGQDPADAFGLRARGLAGPMLRSLAVFFAFMPVLIAVRVGALWLLEFVAGGEVDTAQEIVVRLATTTSPAMVVQIVVAAVFVAPVAEELFFRGLLYGAMRRRLSAEAAIVAVGLLFGFIHAPVAVALPMCILGGLLCYVYEKTARLSVPIVLHMIFNLFSTAMLLAHRL